MSKAGPGEGHEEDNPEGKKIGKFSVVKYLAGGSFGRLYIGRNSKTGEDVAIKMEKKTVERPQLLFEFSFFRKLKATEQNHKGIPRIHYFGPVDSWNALVMDLLGPSLEKVHEKCGGKFTVKTTICIALQLMDIFEYFHGKGLVYRDIKPENFLFGPTGSEKYNIVHIIDLGLCKEYLDESGKHIPFAERKMMTGTIRYMSINSHKRTELSRRDDLEAIGYMLIFFIKGELPWQGVKAQSTNQKSDLIAQIKIKVKPEELCSGLPPEFAQYLKIVRALEFEATPPYKNIIDIFTKLLIKSGFRNDGILDFDKQHNPRQPTSA